MKIRRVGDQLFHADGHTDRHVEVYSCFSHFWEHHHNGLRLISKNIILLIALLRKFTTFKNKTQG
jgi:hypothetical protein